MRSPASYRTLDRVLTDDELVAVWRAADKYLFGAIVRLCILTGQRRGEIVQMRWDWIDEKMITIPGDVSKNSRTHTFPLGPEAKALIETIPRYKNCKLLFPARGHKNRCFSGWSKCKKALDKASGVSDWRLHDIRRTFATKLAALGTPIHITERILNHVSGSMSGIVGVYQRHDYMDEMKAAIENYEEHLLTLLSRKET
jgi:integrase